MIFHCLTDVPIVLETLERLERVPLTVHRRHSVGNVSGQFVFVSGPWSGVSCRMLWRRRFFQVFSAALLKDRTIGLRRD